MSMFGGKTPAPCGTPNGGKGDSRFEGCWEEYCPAVLTPGPRALPGPPIGAVFPSAEPSAGPPPPKLMFTPGNKMRICSCHWSGAPFLGSCVAGGAPVCCGADDALASSACANANRDLDLGWPCGATTSSAFQSEPNGSCDSRSTSNARPRVISAQGSNPRSLSSRRVLLGTAAVDVWTFDPGPTAGTDRGCCVAEGAVARGCAPWAWAWAWARARAWAWAWACARARACACAATACCCCRACACLCCCDGGGNAPSVCGASWPAPRGAGACQLNSDDAPNGSPLPAVGGCGCGGGAF